jgi:hypothetical protein
MGSVPRAHGNTGALSWRVARMVPWGTWRHQSPFLAGGVLCITGHVVTLEPSSGEWRAMCLGARGRARALWHWEWT